MEGYDVSAMGFGSTEYIHHFVEAKKLAFEDRAKYYADPAFNEIPVEVLISKEYANRQEGIDQSKSGLPKPGCRRDGTWQYNLHDRCR